MPTKELMKWVAAEKRWRKYKDGKAYWFNPTSVGARPTKEASTQAANEFWEKKNAELEQAKQEFWNDRKYLEEYDASIDEIRKIIAIHEQIDDVSKQELIDALKLRLAFLEKARKEEPVLKPLTRSQKSPLQVTHEDSYNAVVEWMGEPPGTLVTPGEEDCDQFYDSNTDVPDSETMAVLEDRLKYFEKIAQAKPKEQIPKTKTLGFFIDRYVQRHRKRCDAGEISVDRVDKVNYDLGKFANWFGRDRSIMEIDIHVVEDFYNWLLEQIAARKKDPKAGYSTAYAKDVMAIVKSFLRDLDEDGFISAPKKVYSKTAFKITIHRTVNETVSVADIRTILSSDQVEERTKLFILLALNCGMYQSDISDLRQDEVDWSEGRIIRVRSKRKNAHNPPMVNYKLWGCTLRLLRKYRATENSELVLLNRFNTPLRTMEFIDDSSNRGTKSDCVADAWDRAKKKLKMKKYLFKHFRKTSADLIYNNPIFRGLQDVFLAHAPKSVSEEYYTNALKGILDAPLQWLEKELGIDLL